MKKPKREEIIQRWYKRRFILPNAVTVGNMFCGFLALVYATSGRFDKACLAIALGILLDGFDGKVARKLNATSKFGMEFDSLSDVVTFGVAPAVLMYNWCFKATADEFGVLINFIYFICTASRLARFNVTEPDLRRFCGLPSPAAAAGVASFVFLDPFSVTKYTVFGYAFEKPDLSGTVLATGMGAIIMLSLAYLMVCRIPYISIKVFQMKGMPLRGRLAIGLVIALVWWIPQWSLFLISAGYALSGPIALFVLPKKESGTLGENESLASIADMKWAEDKIAKGLEEVKFSRLK